MITDCVMKAGRGTFGKLNPRIGLAGSVMFLISDAEIAAIRAALEHGGRRRGLPRGRTAHPTAVQWSPHPIGLPRYVTQEVDLIIDHIVADMERGVGMELRIAGAHRCRTNSNGLVRGIPA